MHVLLALTVQLYKLYVSMGAIFLMKDLHGQLRTVEADLKTCPVGDLCAYKFFRGMLQARPAALRPLLRKAQALALPQRSLVLTLHGAHARLLMGTRRSASAYIALRRRP